MSVKLGFSFKAGWCFLRKLNDLQSIEARSLFAIGIRRISRNEYRNRPLVSETTLIGRNDSPPLEGTYEQKIGI